MKHIIWNIIVTVLIIGAIAGDISMVNSQNAGSINESETIEQNI